MKNKLLLIIPAIIILLVVNVNAISEGIIQLNFNDNVLDQINSNDGTWSGTETYSTSYPTFNSSGDGATKSGDFDGSSSWIRKPW